MLADTHWTPSFSGREGRRCAISKGVLARTWGLFFLCWVAFGLVFFALRKDLPISTTDWCSRLGKLAEGQLLALDTYKECTAVAAILCASSEVQR